MDPFRTVIILLLTFSIFSKAQNTNTGHFDLQHCGKPIKITSAFSTPVGDTYIFGHVMENLTSISYLTKLRRPESGRWFRIFDSYPKLIDKWRAEDFTNYTRTTSPDAVYVNNTHVFLFQHDMFYEYERTAAETFRFIRRDDISTLRPAIFNTRDDRLCAFLQFVCMYDYAQETEHGKACMVSLCDGLRRKLLTKYYNRTMPGLYKLAHNSSLESRGNEQSLYRNILGEAILYRLPSGRMFGYRFMLNVSIPFVLSGSAYPPEIYFLNVDKAKFTFNQNFGPMPFQEQTLLVHNSLWFGCPVDDLCLRFNIDGATKTKNGSVLLLVGRWCYEVGSLTSTLERPRLITQYLYSGAPQFVDAAFTDSSSHATVIIKENSFYVIIRLSNTWQMLVESFGLQKLFRIRPNVDATHFANGYLYVYTAQGVVLQTTPSSEEWIKTYVPTAKKFITDLNSNLPQTIDAAFRDPANSGDIILIKNNYLLKLKEEDFWMKTTTHPMSRVTTLFDCPQKTVTAMELLGKNPFNAAYQAALPEPFQKTESVLAYYPTFPSPLDDVAERGLNLPSVLVGSAIGLAIGFLLSAGMFALWQSKFGMYADCERPIERLFLSGKRFHLRTKTFSKFESKSASTSVRKINKKSQKKGKTKF